MEYLYTFLAFSVFQVKKSHFLTNLSPNLDKIITINIY